MVYKTDMTWPLFLSLTYSPLFCPLVPSAPAALTLLFLKYAKCVHTRWLLHQFPLPRKLLPQIPSWLRPASSSPFCSGVTSWWGPPTTILKITTIKPSPPQPYRAPLSCLCSMYFSLIALILIMWRNLFSCDVYCPPLPTGAMGVEILDSFVHWHIQSLQY